MYPEAAAATLDTFLLCKTESDALHCVPVGGVLHKRTVFYVLINKALRRGQVAHFDIWNSQPTRWQRRNETLLFMLAWRGPNSTDCRRLLLQLSPLGNLTQLNGVWNNMIYYVQIAQKGHSRHTIQTVTDAITNNFGRDAKCSALHNKHCNKCFD